MLCPRPYSRRLTGQSFTSIKRVHTQSKVEKMQQLSPEDMGMSMLKGQMAFIVLQGGLMYWASALFNGFAK